MLHGKWILHGIGPDGGQIRREGRNTEPARLQPNGRLVIRDRQSLGTLGLKHLRLQRLCSRLLRGSFC